jgi:Zn-dependent protease
LQNARERAQYSCLRRVPSAIFLVPAQKKFQQKESMPPEYFILRIPAILIALTIHEYAHGLIALRLGDPTARDAGRLTLNPLSHLDIFGTAMLLLGPFGWAKPVPVNGYNFANPKRGTVLVSLAGPASNIALAILFGYLMRLLMIVPGTGDFAHSNFSDFLQLCVAINIGIAFFNLLPVPPLDGSNILAGLLPNHLLPAYFNKMRYVPTIFMVLLMAEWGLHIRIFSVIMNPLYKPFAALWYFVIFWK